MKNFKSGIKNKTAAFKDHLYLGRRQIPIGSALGRVELYSFLRRNVPLIGCLKNAHGTLEKHTPIKRTIHDYENQSTNQSINHSLNRPINQSLNQSTNRPINQSIHPSIHQ